MGEANVIEEFKRDAVTQIFERGYPVAEVSKRLGVPVFSSGLEEEVREGRRWI